MSDVRVPERSSAVVQDRLPCWCGGRWSEVLRTARFGVLRCADCGTHRIDPPAIHSDGESKDFYTDYYQGDGGARRTANLSLRAAQLWPVFERAPELQHPGALAIELGCGDGHLCARLKHAGWKSVIGFEISASRAARARKLYPELDIRPGLPRDYDLQEGCADLVIMEAVIEHIADPVDALAETANLLSPEGRLILTTPNIGSGDFRFLKGRWTGMLAPHAHLFLFDRESMRRMLRAAGMEPLDVGSFPAPFLLPNTLRLREWRNLKSCLWRMHQDLGALYGRWLGEGAMLYAVAARV
ncbi:MAG: class I SAM-dependent methyltransferase [Bryobacteraceae bacterium]